MPPMPPVLQGGTSPTSAGIFDARAIGKLVAKCSSGRALGFGDNMAFVGALSTMLPHEQFVVPARGPQPLS